MMIHTEDDLSDDVDECVAHMRQDAARYATNSSDTKWAPLAARQALFAGYTASAAIIALTQIHRKSRHGEPDRGWAERIVQAIPPHVAPDNVARERLNTKAVELSRMPLTDYERLRAGVAEAHNVRVTALDKMVEGHRPKAPAPVEGVAGLFPTVEQWPERVETKALADEVHGIFRRYLVVSESGLVIFTLFVLHTYVYPARDFSPILQLTSASPGCGKTTALELFHRVVHNGVLAAHISTASLFRIVEGGEVSLLLDEGDTYMDDADGLRGLLNSGYQANGAVIRVSEKGDGNFVAERFGTYCPKVIAAIGDLHPTITSRGPRVDFKRRTKDQPVERLGRATFPDTKRKAVRWAGDHRQAVAAFDMEPLDYLSDRAFDFLLPLFAIASLAGPGWMERALDAARELCGTAAAAESTMDVGVELLRDIREAFGEDDTLASQELLHRLCDSEVWRWCEHNRGQKEPRLSVRQLALLLRPHGIEPKVLRLKHHPTTIRGYQRSQFMESWDRYFDQPSGNSETSETSVAAQGKSVSDGVSGGYPGSVTGSIFD